MKKQILFIIKILITFIGIGFILFIFRNKLGEVFGVIRNCNILLFSIAFIIYTIVNIFAAARLRLAFQMQKINMTLAKSWKLYFIGYFFNIFLPSSVGGDIAKGYYAYKYSGEKVRSYVSVIIDRIIGYLSVVFLCAISITVFYSKIENPVIILLAVFMILLSIILVLFFTIKRFAAFFKFLHLPIIPKKLVSEIKKLYFLVHECKMHKKNAFYAFVNSLIFQVCIITAHFIIAKAMNIKISLISFFVFIPLVYLFSLIPSINGLGVREGAYIYFGSHFTSTEGAFALSLMSDVLLYSCSLIGMFFYLFHKEVSYKEIKNTEINLDEIELKD